MKKYFYSLFAATAMLLATASCSQDEPFEQVNGEKTVFAVALQGATSTRAIGDGKTATKLYYEVYQNDVLKIREDKEINTSTSIELPLLKGEKYDIIFWAQSGDGSIYNAADLKGITVNYDNAVANKEAYDAFYNALDDFEADGKAHTIELRRPFAQLNLGTSDWDEVKATLGSDGDPVTASKAIVEGVANSFNALTGEATGEVTAEFDLNTIPEGTFTVTGKEETYKYLSLNYLLVPGKKDPQGVATYDAENNNAKANVDIEFVLNRNSDELFTIEVPNAPIQRNWRTNVIGDLLTGTSFEIIIKPETDNDQEAAVGVTIQNDVYTVFSADGLAWIAKQVNDGVLTFAGKEVVLGADIDLSSFENWTPIGVYSDEASTVNGENGSALAKKYAYNFRGTFDGQNHTISNLSVSDEAGAGLFGAMTGGTIKNVKIENVTLTTNHYAGAIVGWVEEGAGDVVIENCHVTNGTITATPAKVGEVYDLGDKVGGIVGANTYGLITIDNCSAQGLTISAYRDLGGIAGAAYVGEITNVTVDNTLSYITLEEGATYDNGKTPNQNMKPIVGRYLNNATIGGNPEIVTVTTNEALKEALNKTDKEIYINLGQDVTFDVAAWQTNAMGGDNTETITIDGLAQTSGAQTKAATSNYTLTFNNTNSDWNNIVTKAAKLILKNLTVTNSGKNDGPWNRHDIVFNCEVELINVTSDKAIALKKNSLLKNVEISDTRSDNDDYGLWITAAGQTVTVEDCVFNMKKGSETKTGRGIKIDNQYIEKSKGHDEGKVTLNVSNTIFKTDKKAAILVKSEVGANINLSNIDITEVADDNVTPVWVDENAKAYADLVTVTGGTKVIEGQVQNAATQEALASAVATEGATVYLAAGEYTFPENNTFAEGVTIVCAEGTTFKGTSNMNINGATIVGADFVNPGNFVTPQNGRFNGTFKDCTFKGGNVMNYGYTSGDVLFENCEFVGDQYATHFEGGGHNVTFKNCTISGFNTFGTGVKLLTFEGCTFKAASANAAYNGLNLWGKSKLIDCVFEFDGTAASEWIEPVQSVKNDGNVVEFTNCKLGDGSSILTRKYFNVDLKKGKGEEKASESVITAVVDGVTYSDLENYTFLASKEDMYCFANEVNVNKNTFNGKNVLVTANIDLNNEAWVPVGQTGVATFNGVFNGQNYTISNLNVDSSSQTGANYSSGLFGWVESHTAGHGHIKNVRIKGAKISGNHNCGALVGYITQGTALVENCHVDNATISCTVANTDANGDKAGALIGNATVATPVKNCTASNSTVTAGRDAGQLIGAGKAANVTGCSVTNVTVTANSQGTGANINNSIVGREL